jgi:hypothetical protein
MNKFLTIIVSAAFQDRLKSFLEDINETSSNKKSFEICILIDKHNEELEKDILRYQKKYDFDIKYAMTPFDYGQSNNNYNYGIFSLSDPSTYFIQIVSDRYRFANKDWDIFLKNYIGFIQDDIFFLRTSNYSRHLKARRSLYGAYCFNETWGFYTRKLLEATEGFPTIGISSHDVGFEMLYYYIKKNLPDDLIRDIPVPFFDDSRVVRSIDSDKSAGKFYYRQALFYLRRTDFYNRNLIENLIYQAKRCSLILKKDNKRGSIIKNEKRKFVAIQDGKKIIKKLSYKASFFEIVKAKLEARLGNVHVVSFPIDLLFILQFNSGRKLIKSILKRLSSDKNYPKLSKYLSRFLLKLICKIFFISFPHCRPTLALLSDKDFIESVLINKDFHREFKKHYKILGLFIKSS